VTTILVTHDQDEAFELADRIGVIDRGRLLEVGEPEALYAQPRSLFVSTFLGGGTVLIGRATSGHLQVGAGEVAVPAELAQHEGDRVAMLVRPEQVVVSPEEPQTGVPILGCGTIIEQSFGGALRRVRLRLPRLPGIRQVAPVAPFGEEGLLVDAALPADTSLAGPNLWVSLHGWHLLEAPPFRLLVCDTGAGPTAPMTLARQLAERLRAAVTILGITER
jgi:hypothetical protein